MPRLARVALAVLLLDASLTFVNVWPTPAITWTGQLSLELAGCLLGFAMLASAPGWPWRSLLNILAGCWVVLVLGRYADVTAPALFGRPINLYWDGRHLTNVAAMLANPASLPVVLAAAAAACIIPVALFWPLRWALRQVASATLTARYRAALVTLGVAIVVVFLASARIEMWTEEWPITPRVATPIAGTYARQVRLLIDTATTAGRMRVPASPPLIADLSKLHGADVFVVFVESYGAVAYDRPEFERSLRPARARLAEDIGASGRAVVSAFVESPTFGGSSWLAHISLLSGLEVRSEDINSVLMTLQRDTLVTTFARNGYRTLAVMPGLQQDWPEGTFYHFDEVYGEMRLNYRGPQFGWWAVPDQYTLSRIDTVEVAKQPRQPLFVMFPTISTHTPFSPTAPYQPDWRRMQDAEPYDSDAVATAFDRVPDWMDLGPAYIHALTYDLATLGGYLRERAGHDLVMIVIGDHQPPAAVSGEHARWDVPMHVIASRPELLEHFRARGFTAGITPSGPALMKMHLVAPLLLEAAQR